MDSRGQEKLAELRAEHQYTVPRVRRKGGPVHRRLLTVRGAYRLAQKRNLGLGGGGPSLVSYWLSGNGGHGPGAVRGG